MFLGHNSLPVSSLNSRECCESIHKTLVKRTRQLEAVNEELVKEIAERRQIEESLRQAEQRYRSIFENAVEGIFETTPEGYYQICNPSLARIYGYDSPAELIKNLTNIRHQLYVDPNQYDQLIDQLQSGDAVSDFESQVYRQDGSRIWISQKIRTVRDRYGNLLYYEGFVTDITQQKLAQESLQQFEIKLKLQAEELEEILSKLQESQKQLIDKEKLSTLGQLLAGVAHEINNP
ncbi:MAG TPA: PAS domain-containing sensor histidine kinase, partial [Cyanobacteria bacterium UBA12227]|nr:PAS domain-containing sensor histidine kinase [Cyanobacteria bacterium UBA12227]